EILTGRARSMIHYANSQRVTAFLPMKLKNFVSLFIVACLVSVRMPIEAQKQMLPTDLVIINANVHTLDPQRPAGEAVAVYGPRIVAVGANEEIKRMVGARTRVVDAQGALVVPGFNDAHVHFLDGGYHLASVSLRDANSPAEFAERIRQFAAQLPKGRWLTGGDWDHERWPGAPLPTKEVIDKFTPDNPVFVNRLDGHEALANSLALKLAGVTRATIDPPGGLIVRDAQGEPTGILKDAAMSFVYAKIPAPSLDELLEAARAA